ncbi:MAG: hypothetical protein R2845_13355 [Thermomicrobiales bacterium]
MTSALQENVSGNRVVRAFAQEKAENQRFEAELEELFERNLRAESDGPSRIRRRCFSPD